MGAPLLNQELPVLRLQVLHAVAKFRALLQEVPLLWAWPLGTLLANLGFS